MTISQHVVSWDERGANQEQHHFEHEIVIHHSPINKVIFNVPGAGGSINGYKDKYVNIANQLVNNEIGNVVRMGDPYNPFGWDRNLRNVLNYILSNSKKLFGHEIITIFIMATSAGASAASMIAWEYPEITKMLFLEPAPTSNKNELERCINRYKGDLTVVTGSIENALGPSVGSFFVEKATFARHKMMFTIPNCDHHFSGETNGKIMSQAPIYTFSVNPPLTFPNPEK